MFVSRSFAADNSEISTVVCAPVYSSVLGLRSEVILRAEDGVAHASAIRCDFLMLMFKSKLTQYAGSLSQKKLAELDAALTYALGIRC